MNNTVKYSTKKLVIMALFSALAYATMLVFRIKVVFLTFEAKDALITVAAMILGPLAGFVVSLVVTLLEMVTVSDTGFYGWIMNFVAAASFSVVASSIYRHTRKMLSAVVGLIAAALSMTALMLVLNLLITPIYTGVSAGDVIKMIPGLLLPFNLTKAALNSGLVLVLYKPISTALKRTRMLPPSDRDTYRPRGRSAIIFGAGVVVVVACILILIYALGGNFLNFGGL